MADYETRDGYVFDDTANPGINTPTLARQIGQALDNTRFLAQIKCDMLTGVNFFNADRDGGFSVQCTGYAAGSTVIADSPGHYTTIINPATAFGGGITPGDASTALRDRIVMLTVHGIKPGATADTRPGGSDEIKLGTQIVHPVRELLSFYSGNGILSRAGDSGRQVETSFGGAPETLLFYVHSTTGELRMYWSGSTEIAWVIRVDFTPKQNAI